MGVKAPSRCEDKYKGERQAGVKPEPVKGQMSNLLVQRRSRKTLLQREEKYPVRVKRLGFRPSSRAQHVSNEPQTGIDWALARSVTTATVVTDRRERSKEIGIG